jgi:hypothetical protein
MRGANVIVVRIEKWREVEKQMLDRGLLTSEQVARMCRRELEWALGAAPQEMEV